MTLIWMLLKEYWKYIAVFAVVVAAWVYHNHLTSTISTQRSTITELTVSNAMLTANNLTLQAAIKDTNASIETLYEKTSSTGTAFDNLNKTIQVQNNLLAKKLAALLSDKKPSTCEDTIRYLIEAKKDYK